MEQFFEHLFKKQLELQKRIIDKTTGKTMYELMRSEDIKDRERVSQHFVLASHAELSEFLEWSNWKMWKNARVEYTEAHMKEMHIELIDILHFWANLCIIWDLTPHKIVQLYSEKNAENHNRQDRGY